MMINKICVRRKSKSMTQAELAAACNVSQQLIAKIEVQRGTPSLEVAMTIAKVLGCTIDELFKEEQDVG